MAKLSDLIIKIGADTKELNKSLGDAQRRIQATTGNIQNLGKQMTMGITLPIVGIGAAALKSAAELQTMETSFISLTGGAEQAAAMMEQLNTFAAKTPFQIEGIASAARQLIASGTPISEVNNQLQFLGDIAATSGGQIEDIASIFAKVNAKGKVEMDNLNQLAERGIPIFKALSDATGLPADALGAGAVSVEQFNAVLKSFSDEGGFAAGAMERLSETAAGKFSTALDNLKQAGATLTESLLPVVGNILDGVTKLAQSFAGLSAETKQGILVFGGLVAAAGPMLVILPKLVAGFGMVKVAIMQGVVPALQRMMAFMVANPILLVVTAVVALGVAMSEYVTFADAGAKAQQTYNTAMNQAGVEAAKQGAEVAKLAKIVGDETVEEEKRIAALQRLQQISPEHFGNLTKESALTSSLTESVKAYRMELMRAAQVKVLNQQLEQATARMVELEQEMAKGPSMGDKLLGAFAGPAASIGLMSKRLGDDLGETAATIDLLTAKLSELETPADITSATVAETATQVQTLGKEVKKAATEVDDFAETFRREMLEDLRNTPLELPVKPKMQLETVDPIEEDTSSFDMDFEKDYEKFKEGQEMMREEWQKTANMTQNFSEMFGSTIGNIVSGSQTAGEAMKSLAVSVVKTLIGIAKAAVIANATQTATAAGPAALPMTPILIAGGLSLVEGLLGAIAFADGGIVSGPTLGLVGEYAGAKNNPEVIAPLDKLKSMIGDSGGGNIAVHGKLQGNDINISGERGKLNQSRTR